MSDFPDSSPPIALRPRQPRGGWSRLLLVAATVGAIVATLTGGGGFLLARAVISADSVRCDDGPRRCFARLEAPQLVEFLTDHGYDCREDDDYICELVTVSASYQVVITIGADGQRVERYGALVGLAPGLDLSDREEEFLAWFASLPFRADGADAESARQWVHSHRRPTGALTEQTTVAGFTYTIVHGRGQAAWVTTLGVSPQRMWL